MTHSDESNIEALRAKILRDTASKIRELALWTLEWERAQWLVYELPYPALQRWVDEAAAVAALNGGS